MSRQQPEQQPPPVQRIRLRYAKRGRMRFSSHRDFSRAFERAVSRSGVPIAFSSGFHPHPRISYTGAAPTGAASEAEYLEIALAERVDPQDVLGRLDEALPIGLDIVEAVEASGGSLADRLTASVWAISLPSAGAPELEEGVAALLALDEHRVQRMTKRGLRDLDVRAAIVSLEPAAGPSLRVVMRHLVPSVRPEDVLTALTQVVDGLEIEGALFNREAQGVLGDDGELEDPLGPDRSV